MADFRCHAQARKIDYCKFTCFIKILSVFRGPVPLPKFCRSSLGRQGRNNWFQQRPRTTDLGRLRAEGAWNRWFHSRGPAATTRAPPASHCDIFTEASGTEETDKKSCSKMSENSFRFSRCLLKEIDAQNFGARTMFFRSSRARPLQARSLGAPIPGLRVLSKM